MSFQLKVVKAESAPNQAAPGWWLDAFHLGSGIPSWPPLSSMNIGVYNNVFSYVSWAGQICNSCRHVSGFPQRRPPPCHMVLCHCWDTIHLIAARGPLMASRIYVENSCETVEFLQTHTTMAYLVLGGGLPMAIKLSPSKF